MMKMTEDKMLNITGGYAFEPDHDSYEGLVVMVISQQYKGPGVIVEVRRSGACVKFRVKFSLYDEEGWFDSEDIWICAI